MNLDAVFVNFGFEIPPKSKALNIIFQKVDKDKRFVYKMEDEKFENNIGFVVVVFFTYFDKHK